MHLPKHHMFFLLHPLALMPENAMQYSQPLRL